MNTEQMFEMKGAEEVTDAHAKVVRIMMADWHSGGGARPEVSEQSVRFVSQLVHVMHECRLI